MEAIWEPIKYFILYDLGGMLSSPWTWWMFICGMFIGSFLNVCILRIPEGTFLKSARSHCPHCNTMIPGYHNIPVLSWLLLRGKAACCKGPISIQYPLVEFGTGLIFACIYWKFPFVSGLPPGMDTMAFLRFLHAVVFTCLLLVCSVIDLRLMIIPDVISLPMIALTPLVVYLHPDLNWQSALIGVVVGGMSLYTIAWIYWLIRKEIGMGMGDVKLLAAIGGWLGYQAILPTILYGSILGALIGFLIMIIKRQVTLKMAIPFGPFLALGALIHLFWENKIQTWFLFDPTSH